MPFEELVAGLGGKMLVAATNLFNREKSTLYIFDMKDAKRVRELLAEERAYVEKKKKGHSLPRLFKKHGVSFESVVIPIEHIIVWDREEKEEEEAVAEPKKEEKKEKKKELQKWVDGKRKVRKSSIPDEWADGYHVPLTRVMAETWYNPRVHRVKARRDRNGMEVV